MVPIGLINKEIIGELGTTCYSGAGWLGDYFTEG